MKRSALRRPAGIAAIALSLSVTLAACSNGDDAASTASDAASSAAPEAEPSESAPAETPSDDAAATGAGAETFGEGCALIPPSGQPGSFDGMVTDPVATAASTNPLLGTLVEAVGAVDGLADTLNGLEAATVFAPTDDAFAAVPPDTLNTLLGDQALLTAALTHHVVGTAQLDPESVVGEQTTVNKDTLTVEGDTEGMTVSDGTVTANVLCGNIPTANAKVYVIDAVLAGFTPPA